MKSVMVIITASLLIVLRVVLGFVLVAGILFGPAFLYSCGWIPQDVTVFVYAIIIFLYLLGTAYAVDGRR